MYSRVIMPLDGSKLAEHIIPYARMLASGLQVPIDIVRVVEPIEYVAADPDSYPKWDADFEAMLTNVSTRAGEYVNDVAKTLTGTVPEVNQIFETRDPVGHIVNQANLYPDALIAISTHGRAGIRKWVMGSVTEKVMHSVENPMLIVRPKEPEAGVREMKIENIVVPLDGSEMAEQSLPGAVGLAKALGLGIVLMRAVPSGVEPFYFGEFAAPMVYEDLKSIEDDAAAYLASVGEKLGAQGATTVETVVERGYVPTTIMETSQQKENAIIAMTTHGRTGLGAWIMGSVANKVVRGSGSPVLLTRAAAAEDSA